MTTRDDSNYQVCFQITRDGILGRLGIETSTLIDLKERASNSLKNKIENSRVYRNIFVDTIHIGVRHMMM